MFNDKDFILESRAQLLNQIYSVAPDNFDDLALKVFRYQAGNNLIYKNYLSLLQFDPLRAIIPEQIPALPISLFKTHPIQSGEWTPRLVFSSSGTTGMVQSRHLVRSPELYLSNTLSGFRFFYGNPEDCVILGLLPSYLERSDSSLVFMVADLIKRSKHKISGFHLHDFEALFEKLQICRNNMLPVILIGVSFALLDFAERFQFPFPDLIIMETGGMKGRRKEITRQELHDILKTSFQVPCVHSEYGMTELFSQAYSKANGLFFPIPTMQVYTTEINDPLQSEQKGKTGVINVIDLANVDTCSFIATEDIGRSFADGSFEIQGRLDNSDIRGCNLMVSDWKN